LNYTKEILLKSCKTFDKKVSYLKTELVFDFELQFT